jgi:hypothetical protein
MRAPLRLCLCLPRHANHSTTGIVGLRFLLELLADGGMADVALAILQRTDYPSFGWAINHPLEPATTTWELYDAPQEGPSMNSRNHVMFATPSVWLFALCCCSVICRSVTPSAPGVCSGLFVPISGGHRPVAAAGDGDDDEDDDDDAGRRYHRGK